MDNIALYVEANVGRGCVFAFERRPLKAAHDGVALILEGVEVATESVGLDVHELRQLLDLNCGVQLEEGQNLGQHELLLDLCHKEAGLKLGRVQVGVGNDVVVWGRGGNEFWAGVVEQVLECVDVSSAHASKAVAGLVADERVDRLIDVLRPKGERKGEEGHHLVVALVDLLVLVAAGVVVLDAANVVDGGTKDADSVLVAAQHDIAKAHVVIDRGVAGGDVGEEGCCDVKVEGLEDHEGEPVVAEECIDAEETNDREVAEVPVGSLGADVKLCTVGVAGAGGAAVAHEPGDDVGLVDEEVKKLEDGGDAPDTLVLGKIGDLFSGLALQLVAELAPCLKLVNKLVGNIPEPGGGEIDVDHAVLGKSRKKLVVALP